MNGTSIGLALSTLFLAACASGPRLHEDICTDALLIPGDEILEMGVDGSGRVIEIEYHTTAEHLPAAVRAAAEREIPGGTILSCEKEYHGGKTYWEVEKSVDGLKREIMFRSDGSVLSTEFEIALASAPRSVLDAAQRAVPGGELTSVEEVREGERVAFHVKLRKDGIRYKLIFTPAGELERKLRELAAEVEVPVR